ncbi:2-hydroxyglutaryl-CoA dehydratase [Spirochaetia bacterium]|nr:2-hydroxyglutaryl-CoA dehydratase [Spirochaetia bacterium]
MESLTKEIILSKYTRHNAYQAETVKKLLQEVFAQFPDAEFKTAVCGSGGRTIAEMLMAPYIQEVVANSLAVRTFYPQTRVAIELGGQDAKIVFFHYDEANKRLTTSDMRMNGNCAGGTGSFIDEVANMLRVPVENFQALTEKGTTVYDISGRCGVFAKTDIQPLLNQGGRKEDIALSAFHAIAKQTIGGLSQGLELTPPIIFEGGPFTFNPHLIKVFAEWLSLSGADIIIPPRSETLIAHGAALSIDEMFSLTAKVIDTADVIAKLTDYKKYLGQSENKKVRKYFESDAERSDFDERHKLPPPVQKCTAQSGETIRVYLGIDAGSTTTKFVLLDENEKVVDRFYSSNKGEPLMVIKSALLDMYKKYEDLGITLDVAAVGTTGYGELLFAKAIGADYHTVETVAHAAAAQKYIPEASFILDIGGQDMKAITISNDIVTNITLNEACSSGCGSFLENFASTLKIPVERIAEAAFNAKNPAELGSRCTVFMTSTIITEQKNGKQADDIMAGLCRSIIENVFTKVVRISNFASLGDRIVAQGGTFKNDAVLRALEQHIEKPVIRAPYPGEMGAIGIALLTRRHIAEYGYDSPHTSTAGTTRFIGFEALKTFDYTQQTNLPCGFCSNNCNRTLITFSNGATWVTGNRCERGEYLGDKNDNALREKIKSIGERLESVPDLFKLRAKLLFNDYPVTALAPARNYTVGLPRALDFWGTMPFWKTLYQALGFTVKTSRKSTRKLFESGLQSIASDTVCFPAKLSHGHIYDLAAQKVDRIFMPMVNRVPSENTEKLSNYTCSVVKGYPLVIKYSDTPEKRWGIPYDTPMFHWFSLKDRDFQICRYIKETYNIDEALTRNAITQGDAALDSFKKALVDEGARVLASLKGADKFAVVLGARHYQNDELINHDLSQYFTSLDIPVLTLDSLPGIADVSLKGTRLDITINSHARLLSGAILAAEHPNLEFVQIVSFGCGHDALLSDEISRLLNEISGKSPLILKLDESDVAGPLRIRVRSFIETIKTRRKKEAAQVKPLKDPFEVKFSGENKHKTILVPNVSRAFCKILTSAIRMQGFKVEPLPMGGKEAIALGKKYIHNDICFPAQMVIGEALMVLKNGVYNPDEVVVGMAKFNCDCRLTNYTVLVRKALDEAGFPQVPIISTDELDLKNIHPAFKLSPLSYMRSVWCLVMTDILEDIGRKMRPYELQQGETNRVLEHSIDAITQALEKGGMGAALQAYKKSVNALCEVKYDRSRRKHIVFVTGEYLLNFHPGSNFYVEEYLEKNNMEVMLPRMYDVFRKYVMYALTEIKDFKVHHPFGVYLQSAASDKFFDFALDIMEKTARRHPLYENCLRLPEMIKLSDPVLHHSFNSGETYLIPGDILHHASEGIRSFVVLQPFGCLPNHICGRGVVKRIKELMPDIQVLPLDYDPDSSFANIENRLQMLIMNAG